MKLSFIAIATLAGACGVEPGTDYNEQATTSSGYSSTTLGVANLVGKSEWEIKWDGQRQEIEGNVTFVQADVVIQPGGNSGWHKHGGPAIASVTSGSLVLYKADNPCNGVTYSAGQGFMDMGISTHIARNVGTEPVEIRVQFVLPAGAPARIDQPAPAQCP